MENAFIKINYKMCSYVREISINGLTTQYVKRRSLTTHFTENIKSQIQSLYI